jgi:hypothetical protein
MSGAVAPIRACGDLRQFPDVRGRGHGKAAGGRAVIWMQLACTSWMFVQAGHLNEFAGIRKNAAKTVVYMQHL